MRALLGAVAAASMLAFGLIACGGGSQSTVASFAIPSPAPPPTPTPTPAPTPTLLLLGQGRVDGTDNQFSPIDGDTASGGLGQPVDGITCDNTAGLYHVHAHVSLIVNGVRIAIPDTVGIMNPGPEVNGYVGTGSCFYHLHTHDADNYIHVEDPAVTTFTLGELFDIWGQPLTSSNIAGYAGSTLVYTAQAPSGSLIASNFVQYAGDPRAIVLSSHEEITLEVGPTFLAPPYIPAVKFYTQF